MFYLIRTEDDRYPMWYVQCTIVQAEKLCRKASMLLNRDYQAIRWFAPVFIGYKDAEKGMQVFTRPQIKR